MSLIGFDKMKFVGHGGVSSYQVMTVLQVDQGTAAPRSMQGDLLTHSRARRSGLTRLPLPFRRRLIGSGPAGKSVDQADAYHQEQHHN